MTLGQILISAIVSAGIGYLVFGIVPFIAERYARYYRQEEKACQEILVQAHVEIPGYLAFAFYSIGPILSTLLSFLILPHWAAALVCAFILSFSFRRMGRWISRYLYERRIQTIKSQMIDVMGLMANALRSGMSFLQSMEMAANEMPGAISREFAQVVQETKLGSTIEESLTHFKNRIPLREVASLVDSILILRETGGNLVETFEILIHTLREEERVQGKIKTLTTQGIAQAVVIILLPFGLGAALYMISPEYILPLFEHPLGWVIIFCMLALQTMGALAMRKIVRIEV